MNKTIWNKVIQNFSSQDVEKTLIYHYIHSQEIDQSKSKILINYFDGFELNKELYDLVLKLGINDFFDLEHSLELLIPKKDRELNGAFFTPEYVVNKIINEVNPEPGESCVDLSCGCGAFLIRLLEHFKVKFKKSFKATLQENIFGYDILDYNILRTKILITIRALEEGEIIDESDFNLEVVDSLRKQWDQKFNVIVGNPPYVKFQDLSEENRLFLKSWETIDKGTYNLYFAFFELGFKLLGDNGRLGYITPNNYFTSLAGETLRSFFMDKKAVYKILDFNHYKVFNAQTYTCLTFLNKHDSNVIQFDKLYGSDPIKFLRDESQSQVELHNLKAIIKKSRAKQYSVNRKLR